MKIKSPPFPLFRLILSLLTTTIFFYGESPLFSKGVFIDWFIRNYTENGSIESSADHSNWPEFTPMAFPADYGADNEQPMKDFYKQQVTNDRYCGVMIQNDSAPIYGKRKGSLDNITSYIQKLHFCFADVEYDLATRGESQTREQEEMNKIVSKIRGSSNANVKNAWIGNYGYFPGTPRSCRNYPSQDDNTENNRYYGTSGLNVAQPPCYALGAGITHADASVWGANICPNKRAAMFWRPLDELSVAARALPAGHKLLPWVDIYEYTEGYNAPVPEKVDAAALIQHYRMRKSDGIARLNVGTLTNVSSNSWVKSFTGDQHRQLILDNWNALNAYFGSYTTSFLNLNTTKTTGVEWSGVRYRNSVRYWISNLSTSAKTVSLPAWIGVNIPEVSDLVPANTHKEFTYTISSLLHNHNFDTTIDPWYATGTGGYSATGGVNNGPCLKLSGSQYGAYAVKDKCATDSGAKMWLNLALRGNTSNCRFASQAYCLDATGNYIDGGNLVCRIAQDTTLTTTATGYSFYFTIPNDSRIKYIQPIFYNANYEASKSDVVYVDNVTLLFE